MYTVKNGSLEVIIGPVSSDKSLALVKRLEAAVNEGYRTIGFTSDLSCRDGRSLPQGYADNLPFKLMIVRDAYDIIEEVLPPWRGYAFPDVAGIDDGHFLQDSLTTCVDTLVEHGCRVILASCETDFRGEAFDVIARLMARSERPIERMYATCRACGAPATRSQRFLIMPDGTERPSHRGEGSHTVCIDGVRYEPRCRMCHVVPRAPMK